MPLINLIEAEVFTKLEKWVDKFGAFLMIGLSGGGDSLALAKICAKWLDRDFAKSKNVRVKCVIINHNIAKNASSVAQAAYKNAINMGLEAEIFLVSEKIDKKIQEMARFHRYEIFKEVANREGANIMLLAHNFEDCIETLIFRMMRKTDIFGLCAIRELSIIASKQPLIIARPLLELKREDLRQYLSENDIIWYDDTANENRDFSRVKIRKFFLEMGDKAPNQHKLLQICKKANQFRDIIEANIYNIIIKEFQIEENDTSIDIMVFNQYCKFYKLQILDTVLRAIGMQKYPIDDNKLNNLLQNINLDNFKSCTLAHVQIRKKASKLYFSVAAPIKGLVKIENNLQDLPKRFAILCNQIDKIEFLS